MKYVRTHYPWLRFARTKDAVQIIRTHLENQVSVRFDSNGVKIDMKTPAFFQICLNQPGRIKETAILGAELVAQSRCADYTLYIFEGRERPIRIGLA
jgi:hypothetical protein